MSAVLRRFGQHHDCLGLTTAQSASSQQEALSEVVHELSLVDQEFFAALILAAALLHRFKGLQANCSLPFVARCLSAESGCLRKKYCEMHATGRAGVPDEIQCYMYKLVSNASPGKKWASDQGAAQRQAGVCSYDCASFNNL